LAVSTTIATVLIGLLLALRTWFGAPAVDPRFRYLPHQYDAYTTLNVPELLKSPIYLKGRDFLPIPPRLQTFEGFLLKAGIPLGGVKRISFAGDPKGGAGGVIVYEMEAPLTPGDIVHRAPIQSQMHGEEKVAGKPFFSLGAVALCFPEPKVLLVGRTELLRTTLESAHTKNDPAALQKLLVALDLSKTSLAVHAGLPPSDLMRTLMLGTDLGPRVVSTVDEGAYQDGVCLTRTLTLPDERSAKDLSRFLKDRISRILDDHRAGNDLARLLRLIELSAGERTVVLQIFLSPENLEPSLVELINRLY
jgi:hypothetical protein